MGTNLGPVAEQSWDATSTHAPDLPPLQTFARVAYCAACLAFAAEKMHGGRAPPPESLESGEDDEDEDEDEDESEGRAGKRRRK